MLKNNNSIFTALLVLVVFFGTISSANALSLYRQLQMGMSGGDVTSLQTYLASDPAIYPQGTISGYFGSLTRQAVRMFQLKFGISPVGRVGPQTLAVLNAQGNVVTSIGTPNNPIAPFISSINIVQNGNMATVSWNTNELAQGKLYYDSKPLYTYERENSVDVGGQMVSVDNQYKSSQVINLSNLTPQTTYHFLIYVTDQDGNVSVAWPLTFRTN
jgi:peptidoglycan hydrolase-like protein with peptidoglycan-binding domain